MVEACTGTLKDKHSYNAIKVPVFTIKIAVFTFFFTWWTFFLLDRISLGKFLCLSGFLWLLYGLNGAWYGVRLGLSVHSKFS